MTRSNVWVTIIIISLKIARESLTIILCASYTPPLHSLLLQIMVPFNATSTNILDQLLKTDEIPLPFSPPVPR